MNTNTHAAFATPLPTTGYHKRLLRSSSVDPRRPVHFSMTTDPDPTSPRIPPAVTPPTPKTSAPLPSVWDGVRRVVRLSAISASLLLSSGAPTNALQSFRLSTGAPVAMSSTAHANGAKSSTSSASSDVEAAAITLGVVTLGGLVMRAIVNHSRDETREREKLEAECKRLEEEERIRALRAERKKLESVDDPTVTSSGFADKDGGSVLGSTDADLMSELRKRMQNMDDNTEDDVTSAKDNMRHTPIPDRGMGSAVLDRPGGDSETSGDGVGVGNDMDAGSDGNKEERGVEGDQLAKPDDLEMLKRMWNLNPPEKE